jgi:hypothetical protein
MPVTIPLGAKTHVGRAFVLPSVPANVNEVTVTVGGTRFCRIELDELVEPAAFEAVIWNW